MAANTRIGSGAEARVILNDVRGTQRSNLAGDFEVFGKKADLVIANQNGITCNGCTFINASRSTLSSGAASVDANGDVILNVKKGNVHIGRGGASADGHLNLVGRTVTVDGPLQATVVDAIGGASTYNTSTRAVGANTGSGAAGSLYAVDATQFGAMTAGQIRIIGNENGLGVRTLGKLTSTGTDVSLHSKAGINHGSVQSKRDFVVRGANGFVQQDKGVVTADRNIDIRAMTYAQAGDARMQAAGNVKIDADDAILIAGEIVSATATYSAANRVVNVGEIIASGDVEIVAGEVWNMRSDRRIDTFFAQGGVAEGCVIYCFDLGYLQVTGSANWSDRAYMVGHGGVVAARNLDITASGTDINNSGVLVAAQSLLLDAKRTVTQQSLKGVYRTANSGAYLKTDITKAKTTTIADKIAAMTGGSVRDIYNGVRDPLISGSRVYYGVKAHGIGSLTVKAGHHVQNLGGEFKSNGRVLLQTTNYDVNLRAHGRWSHNLSYGNNVEVIAGRNINLVAAHFIARDSTLKLDARGGIAADQPSIDVATYRNLYIREMGDSFNNTFTIDTPGWVNIASRGTLTGSRSITAASLYLESTHGEVNQNFATRTTGETKFLSSGNMRVANSESSGGELILQSTAGNIYIQGNARATAIDIDAEHSVINGTSTMYAGAGGIDIWAGSSITNEGGRIWSHGNIDLLAGRKRAGNIISSHTTAAALSGYIRAYGSVKNVRLDTDRGTIRLTNNGVIASGNVTLDASGELWVQRSHVEGNTVTLEARTNYIVNELGSLVKANLHDVNTGGGMSLYNRTGGRIWAERDVTVNANAMYNHGQPVTAGRDIRLTLANRLENYNVGVNRAVLNATRNLTITSAKGDIYNRTSDMTAGGNISIDAGADRVQFWDAAKVTTGGALDITAGESGSNRDGIHITGVPLRATSITMNTTGRVVLYPGSDITTTAGDLNITAGQRFYQLDSDLTSSAQMFVTANGASITGSRSQSVNYMKYDSAGSVEIYDGYGRNPLLNSTAGSVDVISSASHVDTRNATINAERFIYLSAYNNLALQTNSTVTARTLDATLKAGVGGHIYYRYGANVSAGRDVRMDSRNHIFIHGRTLTAGRDIISNSRAQVEVYNDGAARARLQAGRNITVNSTQGRILTRTSDWVASTGSISTNAGTHSVEFWGGATVSTAGAFAARAGNWDGRGVRLMGMPVTATSIYLGSGTGHILLEPGADLIATAGGITIDSAGRYYQRDADVTAPGDINITSNGAEIDGSLLRSNNGAVSLTSGSNVRLYDAYNRNPVIWAAGAITIASTNSHFENRGNINGGGAVSVTSRNNLLNEYDALITSRSGSVAVQSTHASVYNRYDGTLDGKTSVSARAASHIYNHGGTMKARTTDLTVIAGGMVENHKWSTTRGRLEAGRHINAQAGTTHFWHHNSDMVAGGNMRVGSTNTHLLAQVGATFTQGGTFTAFSGNYAGYGVRLLGTPITATAISLSSTSGYIQVEPAALTATAGDITIDAAGRFYQRDSALTAAGAISITANGYENDGSWTTANGGGITVTSGGSIDITDAYGRDPRLWATGAISITSANSHFVNNGVISGGGAVSIQSRANLHNDSSALVLSRASSVSLKSTHGNIYNRYSSRVESKGATTFDAVNIYNDGADISAGGRIALTATNHLRVIEHHAKRSTVVSGTDANLSIAGAGGLARKALELRSGTSSVLTRLSDLTAGTTLSIVSANSSLHNDRVVLTAGHSAYLASKGEFRATGGSLTASGVTIDSDHHLYLLTGHRLTARNGAHDVTLDAFYDYLVRDSFVTAGRDVTLSDARDIYIYDSDTHAKTGKVDYVARSTIRHRIEDTDDSNTTAGTDVRMIAGGLLENYRAAIVAGGDIHLESTASYLSNNAADVRAGGNIHLLANRNLHLQDTRSARDSALVSGGNMTITAGDTLYADAGYITAGHWGRFTSRLTPRFYAQVYDNLDALHFGVNVSQGSFTSDFHINSTGAIDIYARDGVTLNRTMRGDNWVRVKSGANGAIRAGFLLRSDTKWLEVKGGGDITLGDAQAAGDVTIESTAGSVINTYNISSSQNLSVKAHKDIIARHSVATRRGAFRGAGSVNMNAGRNMTMTNALVSSNGQIDMLAAQKEWGALSVTTTIATLKAGVENRTTDGKAISLVANYGGDITLTGAEIYGRGLVNTFAGAGGGGEYKTHAATIGGTQIKNLLRGQDVRQHAAVLTLADTDLIGLGSVSQFAQDAGGITMDRGRIQTHDLRIEALATAGAMATYRNLADVTVGNRMVIDVAGTANVGASTIKAGIFDLTNTPTVILDGSVGNYADNNLTVTAKNNLTFHGTSHRRNINAVSLNGVLANSGHLRANFDIRLTANRATAGLNLRNDGFLQATRDVYLNAHRGIDPGRVQARNISVESEIGIITATGAMMADQDITLIAADITTRSVLAQNATIDARNGSFSVVGWQVTDGGSFATGLDEYAIRMGDIVGTVSEVVDGETQEVTEAEFEADLRASGNAMFHVESDLVIDARDDIKIRKGGILSSRGDMNLTAGKGVLVESWFAESVQDVVVNTFLGIQITEQQKQFAHRRAAIVADGDVVITAQGNGLDLSAAGIAGLVAFRDAERVTETGFDYQDGNGVIWNSGTISAGGNLILNAAKDIVNKSTRVTYTLTSEHNCGYSACGSDAYMFAPGELIAGQGLIMNAGVDILNDASQIAAAGSLYAEAGNDIYNDIQTAHFLSYYYYKKKRFLGIKTGETIDKRYSAALQSGVFQTSFGDIDLIAGRNIDSSGSYVSAGANARLVAGNDVYMDAISVELHNYYKNSGFSGFLTYSSTKTRYNNFETSMAQIEGYDVSVEAGNDLTGIGVILLAVNDLSLTAGNDMVFDAKTNRKYLEESGWSFGLTSSRFSITQSVLNNANNDPIHAYISDNPMLGAAYQLATAEDGWGRLNGALALLVSGARTLSTARDAEMGTSVFGSKLAESFIPSDIQAIQAIGNCGGNDVTRCVLEAAGIGFRFDAWHSRSEWDESLVTRLGAGNDMFLLASNDIQLAGGTIVNTGRDLVMSAGNDFLATALANTRSTESSSFGFGVSLFANGFTISVDGSGSNSNSTLYSNASINAMNSITLVTGNDAMLLGAVMQARPVVGVEEDADGNPILDANGYMTEVIGDTGGDIYLDIGNDLVIASQQSTSSSNSWGFGLSLSFTGGTLSGIGINANIAEGRARYVDSPSMIDAHRILDIYVDNTTYLMGSVIASRNDGLYLNTGYLVHDNLFNEHNSYSVNVGLNIGVGETLSFDGTAGFSLDVTEGFTRATISGGDVVVRNQSNFDITQINQNLDAVDTITRDTHINLQLPALNLVKLAEDLEAAGNYIRAATADVPDEVRARGGQAVDQFRELITRGASPAEAAYLVGTTEFRAAVDLRNQYLRAVSNPDGMGPNPSALLAAILNGEEALWDATRGVYVIESNCSSGAGISPCQILVSAGELAAQYTAEDISNYYMAAFEALQGAEGVEDTHLVELARLAAACLTQVAIETNDPSVLSNLRNQIGHRAYYENLAVAGVSAFKVDTTERLLVAIHNNDRAAVQLIMAELTAELNSVNNRYGIGVEPGLGMLWNVANEVSNLMAQGVTVIDPNVVINTSGGAYANLMGTWVEGVYQRAGNDVVYFVAMLPGILVDQAVGGLISAAGTADALINSNLVPHEDGGVIVGYNDAGELLYLYENRATGTFFWYNPETQAGFENIAGDIMTLASLGARPTPGIGIRTSTGTFPSTTQSISVTGRRAIDRAGSYETGVRGLYTDATFAQRQYSVVIDGRRINGVADDVTVIGGRTTAVEAKFVDDWATSLRNPASPIGDRPWAVVEQQQMLTQAQQYSAGFPGGVVYHTNSTQLATHYSRVFADAGVTNFRFVITPTQ